MYGLFRSFAFVENVQIELCTRLNFADSIDEKFSDFRISDIKFKKINKNQNQIKKSNKNQKKVQMIKKKFVPNVESYFP